ncbi:MAG: nucleotidyltransferase domain-containing protein [Candidatus Nanohaloarchaea archaeon]
MEDKFEKLEEILKESGAYAAMFYGSYARGEDFNDIDIAVFSDSGVEEIVREAPGVFDIQRFSDLPMYVRKRVLEEGELFYCMDEERFYDVTIDFVRRYEDFEPLYREYLEGVKAHG